MKEDVRSIREHLVTLETGTSRGVARLHAGGRKRQGKSKAVQLMDLDVSDNVERSTDEQGVGGGVGMTST